MNAFSSHCARLALKRQQEFPRTACGIYLGRQEEMRVAAAMQVLRVYEELEEAEVVPGGLREERAGLREGRIGT